jgi:CheY-like chemotaxis protein
MDPGHAMETPEKRVLVVDDNPVNLKITVALIRRAGFLVDSVETAEQALQQMAPSAPDLILTDLQLPGMNGLELTKAVKTDPARRSVPVILVTADRSKETDLRARLAGCESVIHKPIDSKMLPGVIRSYLGALSTSDLPDDGLQDLQMVELRQEFLASGARECRAILSDLVAQRLFVPSDDFVSIRRALHRWAGTGGTIGFSQITRAARAAEAVFDNPEHDRTEVTHKLTDLLRLFDHSDPAWRSPEAPRRPAAPLEAVEAAPARPQVLIADDDPTIRAVVKRHLDAAGFECRIADDGIRTCALARNHPPDAIVLDIGMPRMDGFQVLYSLRSMWATRHVPVILLTARKDAKDIVRGVELGAADYMVKPFDLNDLVSRLIHLTTRRAA